MASCPLLSRLAQTFLPFLLVGQGIGVGAPELFDHLPLWHERGIWTWVSSGPARAAARPTRRRSSRPVCGSACFSSWVAASSAVSRSASVRPQSVGFVSRRERLSNEMRICRTGRSWRAITSREIASSATLMTELRNYGSRKVCLSATSLRSLNRIARLSSRNCNCSRRSCPRSRVA